jgi:hypothetical protein
VPRPARVTGTWSRGKPPVAWLEQAPARRPVPSKEEDATAGNTACGADGAALARRRRPEANPAARSESRRRRREGARGQVAGRCGRRCSPRGGACCGASGASGGSAALCSRRRRQQDGTAPRTPIRK